MSEVSELSKRVDALDALIQPDKVPLPATRVRIFSDTDTGNYAISGPTQVGLEVSFSVDIPGNTFYQVILFLPDVSGSTGNSEAGVIVDINGSTAASKSFFVGNNNITINSIIAVPKNPTQGSQVITVTVLIDNLTGGITVNNADGASLDVFSYEDVLV